MLNKLKEIDIFKKSYKLNFNGQKYRKTKLGGFLTLFICLLIFAYTVDKLVIMFTYEDSKFVENESLLDPKDAYVDR